MAKKAKQKLDSGFETIEGSISKTEQFIEKYQKQLTIAAVAILVVIGLIFAYKKFIIEPQNEEAQEQVYVAQQYFERDSFNLALNGDGDFPGFLSIIDEYGSSKVAELSYLYAGICYFKLGEFDNAIEYLSDFSTSDAVLTAISEGTLGDSYVELNNFEKAADYYQKAADASDNKLTTPIFLMKLGRVYEELGSNEKAKVAYERIKKDYRDTEEGRSIDKFITRVNVK
jgi:tetratricopeptide (TPR) repeat protein